MVVEGAGPVDRFCQAMTIATPAGLDTGALEQLLQGVLDHHDVCGCARRGGGRRLDADRTAGRIRER
ncbi:hypothetical protein [Streptomyces hygroscopicus]|uniref:hypothetical protein n=1 Tax=Streptomyces hygroscopicus TaxID=1912 RepID=UPI003F1DEAFB